MKFRIHRALAFGLVVAAPFAGTTMFTSDSPYERVAHLIARADFDALEPHLQKLLVQAADTPDNGPGPACCFSGNMPFAFMQAFNAAIQGPVPEFELGPRWAGTAITPGPLGQGDPTVITYSFVPDGTIVPGGNGVGAAAPNDLQATLTSLLGSPAAWQAQFAAAFQQWSDVTGLTYVFEPNDDGAPLFNTPGQVGVRGDVRISGRSIDGQSGGNILAFNNFPAQGGDMVFDTDNTNFWGNPAGNFLRLRNVITHEHGHGIGMFHVCPANQSKLMEPFISTQFDGPQLDDILGANRSYGDRFEHNDTAATATDLGTLSNGQRFENTLTIDDNSDTDWFRFTVTEAKDVSITVQPLGNTYQAGPQTAQCNTGGSNDALRVHDLGVELIDPSGNVVLAAKNDNGLGQNEFIPAFPLVGGAGTYFVRVFGDTTNSVQLYSLRVNISNFTPPAFTIAFPSGTPSAVTPDSVTVVDVQTSNFASSPDPASGQLTVSVDGGPQQTLPLLHLGGDDYQAALPSNACLSSLDWSVSLAPTGGGAAVVSPTNTASVVDGQIVVFADNFNANRGWTVSSDPGLTGGAWQRAVPNGGGTRGDPPADADGSGFAFVTENGPGNTDVDNGATRLTSPVIDVSAFPETLVRFQFWYSNDFGNNPNQDIFLIEMNTGSGFQTVESYNGNANAWLSREVPVNVATSTLQFRFTASDPAGLGSVVEAGVDAFEVVACPSIPRLEPSCEAGNVGASSEAVFRIAGSDGGTARRVIANTGQSIVFDMQQPSTSTGAAPFAVFAGSGVPGPGELLPVPGIGTLCLGTVALAGGPIVSGVSAPWQAVAPGSTSAFELTMQGVILESAGVITVTNAITLEIR